VDVAVLLDGVFNDSSAVQNIQILECIQAGVEVYGAASMGALRAVELQEFGMHGVGAIFKAYASRQLLREEELYVCYDPFTLRATTVPTIVVRSAVALALGEGVLSIAEGEDLLSAAQSMNFTCRTWDGILDVAPQLKRDDSFRALISSTTDYDIKRTDSIDCLRLVASELGTS
jgi:hypothetical protein